MFYLNETLTKEIEKHKLRAMVGRKDCNLKIPFLGVKNQWKMSRTSANPSNMNWVF